ncbi:MAG: cupin domain-containing protein [Acidihalobacter sp.]|uniref:cupin domain-containing protein n=1 Tax=Acidihalobacter sp. TaxID=1872108 RepID=UPI00307F7FE2
MFKISADSLPATLDAWGTVADLGSIILEGECRASGALVAGNPESPVSCGWFSVSKGKFRMTYPFTEHAVVVEGRATLTDETNGVTQSFGPGDGWFVEKGTVVLWEVETDEFTKNYLAVA